MIDPNRLTMRELARRIQQTDNAYEARELSRELRVRAETYAQKRHSARVTLGRNLAETSERDLG
jgi:hypothetical protein